MRFLVRVLMPIHAVFAPDGAARILKSGRAWWMPLVPLLLAPVWGGVGVLLWAWFEYTEHWFTRTPSQWVTYLWKIAHLPYNQREISILVTWVVGWMVITPLVGATVYLHRVARGQTWAVLLGIWIRIAFAAQGVALLLLVLQVFTRTVPRFEPFFWITVAEWAAPLYLLLGLQLVRRIADGFARQEPNPPSPLRCCNACGYLLEGLPEDTRCPECGTAASESGPVQADAPIAAGDVLDLWIRPTAFYARLPNLDVSAGLGIARLFMVLCLLALPFGIVLGGGPGRRLDTLLMISVSIGPLMLLGLSIVQAGVVSVGLLLVRRIGYLVDERHFVVASNYEWGLLPIWVVLGAAGAMFTWHQYGARWIGVLVVVMLLAGVGLWRIGIMARIWHRQAVRE